MDELYMIVVKIVIILVFGFKEKFKNILWFVMKCLRKFFCNVIFEQKFEIKVMELMKFLYEDEDYNDNIYLVQLSCIWGLRYD